MKPLKRLTAAVFLTAALAGGSLTLAGAAAADDTTGTPTVTEPTTPGTDGTDGTDDTWWGLQPTNPTPSTPGTTARPADTWWG